MKKLYFWMLLLAVVMLGLPWLAVTFVKGDAGMAVVFILFFAVNPVYSAVLGAFSGKDVKKLWFLPLLSALMFLIGTWIFFEMNEPVFILYAAAYLVVGAAAMLISALITKKANKDEEKDEENQ